ncbi:IS3 family transposase [Cerasibacillus sp. JNUCC 74]
MSLFKSFTRIKQSINLLCEIAGIARSAYYKWLNRTPSSREIRNKEIIKEVQILHEKVDGIFGYRQMTLHMNRKFEEKLNHKRIYRLMKVAGLRLCHSCQEEAI